MEAIAETFILTVYVLGVPTLIYLMIKHLRSDRS